MIQIPQHIETVPREASARLLEKQWHAKIRLRGSIFAMAMNNKWRHHFKEKAKKQTFVYRLDFKDVSI